MNRRPRLLSILCATTAAISLSVSGLEVHAEERASSSLDPGTAISSNGTLTAPRLNKNLSAVLTTPGLEAKSQGVAKSTVRPEQPEGTFGPNSIIGSDDRVRVTPTTVGPAPAVVFLSSDVGTCSGFLYAPNVVATAGHCVHGGPTGDFVQSIRAYPGSDGIQSPFGFCTGILVTTTIGWIEDGNSSYDIGAVKLDCNIGITTGYFGLYGSEGSAVGIGSDLHGYPAEKSFEQWKSSGIIQLENLDGTRILYPHDTTDAMSGGPLYNTVLHEACSPKCAFGIHTSGLGQQFPENNYNSGTKINIAKFDFLVARMNE